MHAHTTEGTSLGFCTDLNRAWELGRSFGHRHAHVSASVDLLNHVVSGYIAAFCETDLGTYTLGQEKSYVAILDLFRVDSSLSIRTIFMRRGFLIEIEC
jgi:hypothetical protein